MTPDVDSSGGAPALPRRFAPLRLLYRTLLRPRRTRRIGELLAPLLPASGTILDVGCGDGHLTAHLRALRPELSFVGVDVLGHSRGDLEIHAYEGGRLPFDDASFDAVLLCAVLHHLDDPAALLAEARRVARREIILLDHRADRRRDHLALRVIDWPGNVPFGVYTPYNFLSTAEWRDLFARLDLRVDRFEGRIGLFGGGPLERVFGGELHFTCRLSVPEGRAP